MKTLVIGASPNPERYSYKAVQKLLENKHEVVAVGLRIGSIGKVQIQAVAAPIADIHTITLYVSADNQPELYNYIIDTAPKRIIFNPNTENPDFYPVLQTHLPNIQIEISCTLVLLATGAY
jgi:uncharacterized protein